MRATEARVTLRGTTRRAVLVVSAAAVAAVGSLAAAEVAPAGARESGAPHNDAAPSISGNAVERGRLKAERGTWSGATPLSYADSWSRCDSSGGECKAIAGAGRASYKPALADVGHRLTVTVKATNKEGTSEQTSPPSAVVASAAPKRRKPGTISGEAVDGRLLTVSEGTWKGTTPFTFTYQWLRCTGRTCEEISGATAKTYRAQTADIGKKLRALVTAHNAAGHATGRSKASAKVVPGSPLNLTAPSIEGTPLPGQTLKAANGTWVGTPPIEYTYQWLRCPSLGGSCTEIPGATGQTYGVGSEDIGDAFKVTVTATNAQGKEAVTSSETSITGGGVTAPENVVAPQILGLAVTGQELTATEGTWKGTAPAFSYQWELCNAAGAECNEIKGASAKTFKIPDGDAGHRLRVTVTAANSAGKASASSQPTAEVLGVGPTSTEPPSISGEAKEGALLSASAGKWTGTEPITYEYEWLRCNSSGGECSTAQAGSALPSYLVSAADATHTLRVKVIATNLAGKGEAESEPTGTVAGTGPENVVAPLVLGLAITGQELTATEGTWKGTEPISYAFQWQLCSKAGSGCENIEGATSKTFKLPDGDAGHTVRVVVTAKNVVGSVAKASEASPEIVGVGPQNTEAPSISGEAKEGALLTASSGKWSGTEPITYEYEWLRCNTAGTECATAQPASALTAYKVAAADVGHRLKVKVLAKNVAGTGEAESPLTAGVAGFAPENVVAPLVLGLAITGQELTATEGTWSGTEPISYAFQWQLCSKAGTECKNIEGATSSKFKIPDGDAGKTLVVVVTAKNVVGSVAKASSASSEIQGVAPTNSEAPSISGEAKEGALLTASSGKWSGTEPITYEYEWIRCNASGAECSTAQAASALTVYKVAAADVGHRLKVKVLATNVAGKGEKESALTAGVAGIAPENTIAPLVIGLAVTGQELSATEGTWKGTEPFEYSFQWQLCSKSGTECKNIEGETKKTFKIPDGDAGRTIRVVVTAKNVAGSTAKASEASPEIQGVGPANSEAPKVTGTTTAGQALTATSGKWSGTEPITYEYEWLRCNASGAECKQAAAASALGSSYTLQPADVGHTMRAKVIATNIAGKGEAESTQTGTVAGVKPSNTLAPTVLGVAATGQELSSTEGTWSGTEPISYAFRWQRCSKAGTECKDISGASKAKYVIVDEDAGHTLRAVVTASNVAGSTEKESSTTTEVLGVSPKNTEAPKVTGTTTAGQALTATSGKWSGTEPIAYEYEWLRCNTSGAECSQAAAASALGSSYTLQPADVGHTMRAKVIATNIAGKGEAESTQTGTVAGVKPSNTLAPTVIGAAITGQELSATEGTWSGTEPITYAFQWQLCSKAGTECKNIEGATSGKFKIPDGDAGHTLRVVVTAKNVAGSTEKESATTSEVLGVTPKNTEVPAVSGEAKEGVLLTASSGKWSGTEPITYEYEWLRCNTEGKSCLQAQAPSILATYTVAVADVGKTLRVKVIAKNVAGKGEAESEKTATVKGVPPANVLAPLITGVAATGQELSTTEGTWTGSQPITYSYQWQFCKAKVCANFAGATGSKFKIPSGHTKETVRVVVTAKNVAGETPKESLETTEILL